MDIVFCADRRVIPGLHVAAYSILERAGPLALPIHFYVYSNTLHDADIQSIHRTLKRVGKAFSLELRSVDVKCFDDFPTLNGSWATYYRLHVARTIASDRFLYVDADTLCDLDVGELMNVDFGGKPAAWVPEAPLSLAVDRAIAKELGNSPREHYFNAGVILINGPEWKQQQISELAIDYISVNSPRFHDQSALNVVLREKAVRLEPKFNRLTNGRKNWSYFTHGLGSTQSLMHFIDYPKPWDLFAEVVHPHYFLWRSVLNRTEFRGFRSWSDASLRKWPQSREAWNGYRKAIKDRLLFTALRTGLFKRVKGMS